MLHKQVLAGHSRDYRHYLFIMRIKEYACLMILINPKGSCINILIYSLHIFIRMTLRSELAFRDNLKEILNARWQFGKKQLNILADISQKILWNFTKWQLLTFHKEHHSFFLSKILSFCGDFLSRKQNPLKLAIPNL